MILAVILLASHIFHLKFHVTFKGFTHYVDLHHGEESQWCPLMSETVHYYLSLNLPFFRSPPCEMFDKCLAGSKAGLQFPTQGTPWEWGAVSKGVGLQLSACLMQDLVMVILANPRLPQQLTAQSWELKLPVGTREQNLYTNEIICMKCYFNKTA